METYCVCLTAYYVPLPLQSCCPCKAAALAADASGARQLLGRHTVNLLLTIILADSAGSFATPPQTNGSSCLPAQLVAVGKTLQLQVSSAPMHLQAPILAEQQRYSCTVLPSHAAQSQAWQQGSC